MNSAHVSPDAATHAHTHEEPGAHKASHTHHGKHRNHPAQEPPAGPGKRVVSALAGVALVGSLLALGIMPRLKQQKKLDAMAVVEHDYGNARQRRSAALYKGRRRNRAARQHSGGRRNHYQCAHGRLFAASVCGHRFPRESGAGSGRNRSARSGRAVDAGASGNVEIAGGRANRRRPMLRVCRPMSRRRRRNWRARSPTGKRPAPTLPTPEPKNWKRKAP